MSLAFQIYAICDGFERISEIDWVMVPHASHTFGGRRIETPRGGEPPPTHSWRICDRGLVLAGVLGVLGFLGILAKNLEQIVPEPSQIEFRGLQNQARGVQNRARSPPRRYF